MKDDTFVFVKFLGRNLMKKYGYLFGGAIALSLTAFCFAEDAEPTVIDGTEFIEGDTLQEKEEAPREERDRAVQQQDLTPSLPSGRIPRQSLPRNPIPRNRLPSQSIPRIRLPDNKVPRESIPRNRVPRRRLERTQIERNPLPRNRIPRNPLPRSRIKDERREWVEELERE